MKVKVKLYGTLSHHLTDYRPSQGIEIELPDGATAKDLLTHLELPESQGAVAIAEGRTLKPGDKLQDGVPIMVFQAIRGG
jgi:sulfur carrier protein ThiS